MEISVKVDYDLTSVKRKNFNILIIDDGEDHDNITNMSHSLKSYLELRGHRVHSMDEGIRSLYNIVKNDYDIIFVDYHLKNDSIDGAELTECIKKIKDNIIFAYTQDTSNSILNKFKKNGSNGIVYKPIKVNILDKLMNILEMKHRDTINKDIKINDKYKKSLQIF